ncbi:hypothetical protein JTE90_027067, partial [Oedothorax gibbosus]
FPEFEISNEELEEKLIAAELIDEWVVNQPVWDVQPSASSINVEPHIKKTKHIITDRQEHEAKESEEKALAKQEAKEQEERAFELEKLKLQAEASERGTAASNRQNEDVEGPRWELRKLIQSFDSKEDDMDKFEAFENLRSGVRRGPNPDYKKRNFHKQKDEAPRRENFREPFPQRRDENRRPEARRENTRFNNGHLTKRPGRTEKSYSVSLAGHTNIWENKCPRLGQRTQAATNRVDVQPIPIEEGAPHILTAKISVPVYTH